MGKECDDPNCGKCGVAPAWPHYHPDVLDRLDESSLVDQETHFEGCEESHLLCACRAEIVALRSRIKEEQATAEYVLKIHKIRIGDLEDWLSILSWSTPHTKLDEIEKVIQMSETITIQSAELTKLAESLAEAEKDTKREGSGLEFFNDMLGKAADGETIESLRDELAEANERLNEQWSDATRLAYESISHAKTLESELATLESTNLALTLVKDKQAEALERVSSIRPETHVSNTMGESWKWKDGAGFDEVVECVRKMQALAATLPTPPPRGKVDYSGVLPGTPDVCSKELHYQHDETGRRLERACAREGGHHGDCLPKEHPGLRWYICTPIASPDEACEKRLQYQNANSASGYETQCIGMSGHEGKCQPKIPPTAGYLPCASPDKRPNCGHGRPHSGMCPHCLGLSFGETKSSPDEHGGDSVAVKPGSLTSMTGIWAWIEGDSVRLANELSLNAISVGDLRRWLERTELYLAVIGAEPISQDEQDGGGR